MPSFADLEAMLETDADRYRLEVDRMRVAEPERLEEFVTYMRAKIEAGNELADRPVTAVEIRDMIDELATALGWSRGRVMAEALTRLRGEALAEGFRPLTPPDAGPERKAFYARRHSSIRAMVTGDYRANPYPANTRAARMRSQELPIPSTYRFNIPK